ncbi:MAG TPA: hypothetical protein O0Y05_03830 [Methanocorpusculum sp.]|nr:hypothetical protein [Methanocorpusculum sp.]
MSDRNILFVCEGSNDEPKFLKALMKKTCPEYNFKIYSYNTTIHTLAYKLRKYYPDFDSGDTDIAAILKDLEEDEEKRSLLSERFSDIILAFDFDPHHKNPDFEMVERMLTYYVESSDMGKLYINYPMMQSYRHVRSLSDMEYLERYASPRGYKELVSKESGIGNLSQYGYNSYMKIASLNVNKAWYFLTGGNRFPSREEYLSIRWSDLYAKALDHYKKTLLSPVLNTLIFFKIDFNTQVFFNQLVRHPDKFQL